MYVCLCKGISDKDLVAAIRQGARTADDVSRLTGAGTCCGTCRSELRAIVERSASRSIEVRSA